VRQFLFLVRYYFALTALFVLAKPCFMFAQDAEVRGTVSAGDVWAVVWHGLPLDLATAGYLTAVLWLVLGVSLWRCIPHLRIIYKVYVAIISALLALIWVADTCLYGFWGIKLDGTALGYLDSPQGTLNSISTGYALGVTLAILLTCLVCYAIFSKLFPRKLQPARKALPWSIAWLLIGGLLFLGIRGGVGRSTANVGMVYYSDRQFLNHSAVNPAFSVASSLFKTRHFADEYNFFDESERERLFDTLHFSTSSELAPTDTLLSTSRPNVLLIIMEGCGGTFVNAVDSSASPSITPNLNRLAREGVLFSQCYANSFRTDRGTVCTLSGYPAYPDVSVMKIPALCQGLPSIAGSLKRAGYTTSFLYGGDINFTNTNGYLLATGYERTVGDTDFPSSVRRTHAWGVTDAITFDTLYARLLQMPTERPWHVGMLTLASHEPWKVPYDRIKNDEKANAMAYLDDCIGRFIEKLKRTPLWANTLVILLPDHGIGYPAGLEADNPRTAHIPLIWTGGAVRVQRKITSLGNQSDLAATLLGQLGIPHADFRFSRDVLSTTYTRPSALHAWSGGMFLLDATGVSSLNLVTKPVSVLNETPRPSQRRMNAAKAYLQTTYDALERR